MLRSARTAQRRHRSSDSAILGSASFTYNYTTGSNNGQIASAVISGEQVNYTYDGLKRLTKAQTSTNSWGQGFVYDGFGNLTQKTMTAGSGVPTISMTVDATTNRITSAAGLSSYSYDANGNVLSGPNVPSSGQGMIYDCRNRIIQVPTAGSGSANTAYAYDGANHRVWKGTYNSSLQLTGETYYLYDTEGTQLGSYTLSITMQSGTQKFQFVPVANHIYFAGKHVADRDQWGYGSPLAPDRLGSEMTYFPYGDEKGTVTANDRVKFATYVRDSESNLDYAVNRYYSAPMARFLSPDPSVGAARRNPQSWNRYTYVLNDPVNFNDALGFYASGVGEGGGGGGSAPGPGPGFGGDLGITSSACQAYLLAAYRNTAYNPDFAGFTLAVTACEYATGAGGGGSGSVSPQDVLQAAKTDVAADLRKPNCAKDYKNTVGDVNRVATVEFSDYGRLQFITQNGIPVPKPPTWLQRLFYPCRNAISCYNAVTGSISLNSSVNWVDPNNTPATLDGKPYTYQGLSAEANALGVVSITPTQYADLAILHELEHADGTIGDPDDPAVEAKIWNDCVH